MLDRDIFYLYRDTDSDFRDINKIEYRLIKKKGEGTFSEVIKAQCIKNGKYCAIKCMKNVFKSVEQVNNLREIQALRRLSPHPNIISLYDVLYDQPTGKLALVFELMEHNLYECIKGKKHHFPEETIKLWMYQAMKALEHMHRNGIFHRDIKPENILIKDGMVKLADFGSCRGIFSKKPYTEYISTRWYRAPECLLTDGYYNEEMDIWGMGCVIFELLTFEPLFPGANEMDQIKRIHSVLGTPPAAILDKFKPYSHNVNFNFPPQKGCGIRRYLSRVSQEAIDLIEKMLTYDPDQRITAKEVLQHPWFGYLYEQDLKQQQMRNEYEMKRSSDIVTSSSSSTNTGNTGNTGNTSTVVSNSSSPSHYRHSHVQNSNSKSPTRLLPNIRNSNPTISIGSKSTITSLPSINLSTMNKNNNTSSMPSISSSVFPTIASVKLQAANDLKYDLKPITKEPQHMKKYLKPKYLSPYSQKYLQQQRIKQI